MNEPIIAESTDTSSERVQRLDSVMRMATEVFGDEAAAKVWMRDKNISFDGAAPMDYLDTELGAQSVKQVLNAIATGGPA